MPRRTKKRSKKRDLDDDISKRAKERAIPRLSQFLARYVLVAALSHLFVILITIVEITFVPWWTLYFRILVVVRAFLLLIVVLIAQCGHIPVLQMYGSGLPGKELRSLRPMPLLASWYLLGYFDIFFRYTALVLDAVSPFIPQQEQSVHASIVRAVIDIGVIIEYYITKDLIYKKGVRMNVYVNLIRNDLRTVNV